MFDVGFLGFCIWGFVMSGNFTVSDDRILGYPIRQLAQDLGLRPERDGRDTFFAPGRDEKTASLKLYPDRQRWRDYGAGCGGGLLDLILYCLPELDAPSVGEGGRTVSPKARAMEYLKTRFFGTSYRDYIHVPRRSGKPEPSSQRRILVENWRPGDDFSFTEEGLLAYAARRCWHPCVLRRYCRQVRVSVKGTRHRHVLIGFPNIANGYVLRGPGKYSKISTNQDVSTIDAEGRFSCKPLSRTLLVFEGFGNFLAWLSYRNYVSGIGYGDEADTVPRSDVLVLNSWQNIGRPFAQEYAGAHSSFLWYGDNDEAGYKALDILRGWDLGPVENRIPEYDSEDLRRQGYAIDDFNDFLMAWCEVRERGNRNRKQNIVAK